MAYQFEIDVVRRLIAERLTGDVTLAALVANLEIIAAHPEFDHSFDAVSDYSDARLALSSDDLRRFQAMVRSRGWPPPGRRAIIAPRDFDFGVARQAGGLWQLEGFMVFRDREAAMAWLEDEA